VDGDFWHGNVAKARGFSEAAEDVEPYGRWANPDFWSKKIGQNVARDRRVNRQLKELGWTVIRVWESELDRDLESNIRRVMESLGKAE